MATCANDLDAPLGPMALVRQRFEASSLNVDDAVDSALDRLGLASFAGRSVAVGVGSRGVADYASVVARVCDRLKLSGARPFIAPAMGSHGGATEEGQVAALAAYGITESALGVPVWGAMGAREIGRTESGMRLWFSDVAFEADAILVVNRIKPHTDFVGAIGSGPLKMLTVGFGKREGAADFHQAALQGGYERVLLEKGAGLLRALPKTFGLGIVENARHQIDEILPLSVPDWIELERAAHGRARLKMASLPVEDIDLLIVDRLGKNISGTGMDTNVIGRDVHGYSTLLGRDALRPPFIKRIYVRDLTNETRGNAIGIGLADFTHRRLVDKIDFEAMRINTLTSLTPSQAKIPIVFDSDRMAIASALRSVGVESWDEARIVRIPDTLNLETFWGTTSVLADLAAAPGFELAPPEPIAGFD